MQPALLRKLDRLDLAEIDFVRAVVSASRGGVLNRASRVVTFLSNGWLYLAAAWVILYSHDSRRPLVAALASVALAFIPYFLIKPMIGRLRPCDRDPLLGCGVKQLDQFSCPSGHVMAAAAFGIPMIYAFPGAMLVVAGVFLLICWARVAVGHHYPSDLIFGLLIGASVALPIATMLL